MGNVALFVLSLTLVVCIVGCGQPKDVVVPAAHNHQPALQDTPPHQRDHSHAFAHPAHNARQWNDPSRDKWQHPEEIIAALALPPGATVADIGAGTGYMVAALSKAVGQDGKVIALDASAEMIAYLTEHSPEWGPATIVPRKVGPDAPGLEASSVDGVLTLDTWHHIKGQEAYGRKVFEALRSGGRFVIVEHNIDADVGPPLAMRLEPGQVVKQLEAAGFRAEIVPESMPRHFMVVGYKD